MNKQNEWKMPEWMEKYRDFFTNTGGNSVEDLQNSKATLDNNAIVAMLAVAMHAQVSLLERMHEAKLI